MIDQIYAIDIWLPFAVVWSTNLLFSIWCFYKKDNSYIDVWYGLSFIWPLAAVIISRLIRYDDIPIRVYVVFALVAIWGIRLAIHIGIRHNGEDFRYVKMRKDWNEAGGHCGFVWRSLLYIFSM